MTKKNKTGFLWGRWITVLLAVTVLVWVYRAFDLGSVLSLEELKESRDALTEYYAQNRLVMIIAFFAVYVTATAVSIPGAVILTLAGGAIFGFWLGLLVISFASSLGALSAFLVSRYLLRDWVQRKFQKSFQAINSGIERDGVFYLLTLRLVPLFPFWLINLLMGLTQLRAPRFYTVSQIGMLPGTAVFVNAGTQLALINSLGDVLSAPLIGSLVLLGLFPLVAKFMVGVLKNRKIYQQWQKPKTFDRNLIVIGGGAGGLVSAYIASVVKARVTLIETHKMGGDCLNFGCVPSKALIRSAKMAKQLRHASELGFTDVAGKVDFAAVMRRIHGVIADIEPHDSVDRYTKLGVEVLTGYAKMVSPWEVEIALADGTAQRLSARHIIIATGARPFVPPIPGLEEAGYLTSDTVWNLTALPKRFVVLGGGPIGAELSQSFARLGSSVTQVEMGPRIMSREDPEVSALVTASLRADGVEVLTSHQALRVEQRDGQKFLIVKHEEGERDLPFDALLCAVGRAPRVTGYGLETLGVTLSPRNNIAINAFLETNYPNIFAVGDVAGPYQLTHAAAHQAWYAAVNALFGRFKKFKADYSVIPWTTFTDPEVARVGLSETEATAEGIDFEVTRYGIDDLDRAIADGTAYGFVKVLTVPGKDKILGVTIVGEHGGDLLAEFVLAMRYGLGLNKILGTIHTYPTLSEANKYAAGEWKKAHVPHRLLKWVERYHAWERG
jgi:pyruvate/2-oxoglutarate dehydrogenase complex dihydrolipoamide dehydrogenase (E3) component